MFTLSMQFATLEDLQDAAMKLSEQQAPAQKAVSKAVEKKAEVTKATTAGAAPKAAASLKGAKAKKYNLAQLKEHILTLVDGSEGEAIKAYVRTFGVAKFSDLTDENIQEAYAGAEAYFAGVEDAEDSEDDMMD